MGRGVIKKNMEKETKKSFGCHRINKFNLNFPNGNSISTIWGSCTYSDNYNTDYDFTKPEPAMQSNTVEVMFSCPPALYKRLYKKYSPDSDNTVIGWLTIEQWTDIVYQLSKPVKRK